MAESAPSIKLPPRSPRDNSSNEFFTPRSTFSDKSRKSPSKSLSERSSPRTSSHKSSKHASPRTLSQKSSKRSSRRPSGRSSSRSSARASPRKASAASPQPTMLSLKEIDDMVRVLEDTMIDNLQVDLVSRPDFIAEIYGIVANSASLINNVNSLFRWGDITVIGGAALVLYDAALLDYKRRHQMNDLRTFFEKGTADIDMTWNIAASPKEKGISFPADVISTGDTLVNILKGAFAGSRKHLPKEHILNAIHRIILNTSRYDNKEALFSDLTVHIVSKNVVETYGSYSIGIEFHIRGHVLKIADLTLHDAFNSQQYSDDHEHIDSRHSALENDPTYCTSGLMFYPNVYIPSNTFLINVQNVMPVRVPLVHRYIYQQLFAAGNLLLSIPIRPKGYVNLKRAVYMIKLFSISSPTEINAANISRLLFDSLTIEQERFIMLLFKKIILLTSKSPQKEEVTAQIQDIVRPIATILTYYQQRALQRPIYQAPPQPQIMPQQQYIMYPQYPMYPQYSMKRLPQQNPPHTPLKSITRKNKSVQKKKGGKRSTGKRSTGKRRKTRRNH
jgi:hypothetical protein